MSGTVCGICGAAQTGAAGARPQAVVRQLAMQRHRGPDAEGWFGDDSGVVAQNRLSVIDLVTGDPPMTNEDQTIGAVLNGEIYNFRAIREELLASGHTLSSKGDTETLAHLAEHLGARDIARRLDGMFAFAIWDKARRRLMLGRDRFGKKPLYYWQGANGLVFASEIKGVLAHPAVPRVLNTEALPGYLTFGYVPTPDTFFDGIHSVPAAHVLTYQPGGEPELERYWRYPVPGVSPGITTLEIDMDEAAGEVRRLLTSAIRRRLISDVPLGAFLSGGIDSSAIVALMADVMGEPVKTFTVGFDDADGFDERPYARAVARRFGTEHHEDVASPRAVELVERLVQHHDQPFGDSSAIPTYLLSEVTRRHVTVALSGDGGDELFAGYERFAAGVAVDKVLLAPQRVRSAAKHTLDLLPASAAHGRVARLQRFGDKVERGMPDAYREWVSYVPDAWRRRLMPEAGGVASAGYKALWSATRGAKALDRLLALNLETYLPDDLLVKADRMSMAHALEVRSPFLDRELVEFTARLPPALKARGLSLKRVLKRSVAGLLPTEILRRPKRGFGVPLDRWFRSDLASYTDSTLGKGARVREHVRGEALDELLGEHRAGRGNHGHALWTLLTLELFLRRNGW